MAEIESLRQVDPSQVKIETEGVTVSVRGERASRSIHSMISTTCGTYEELKTFLNLRYDLMIWNSMMMLTHFLSGT